jgi:ribonuclease D
VVQQSKNRLESDLPLSIHADSEPIDKKKLMLLKKTVDNRATELGISPELLSRRRDLESLLRTARRGAAELPEFMKGWREEVIGHTLLEAVQ